MQQEQKQRPGHTPSHAPVQGLSRRAIMMAITLFTLVIIGMFTFALIKKQEMVTDTVTNDELPVAEMRY